MKYEKLSQHYEGTVAEIYDQHRQSSKKWQKEQRIIEELFRDFPDNLSVIDIPVGTGRFFDIYKQKDYKVTGVDISEDMLDKAKQHPCFTESKMRLSEGDIFNLEYPDNTFEISVCIRFLNLVDENSVAKSIKELARVSNHCLVVGIRHVLTLGELRVYTGRGLKTFLRQIRSRIKKRREGKVIFHNEKRIRSVFNQNELMVRRKECIENRKDGTDYYIYVLEKASG